jgi:hypothetical protein
VSADEVPDPATLRARCPACGAELWDVRQGQHTLANRILKLRNDGTLAARCTGDGCTADVPLPFLRLVQPPAPEQPTGEQPRRRFVVRRLIPSTT